MLSSIIGANSSNDLSTIIIPQIESVLEISKKNRAIVKERLTPMLMYQYSDPEESLSMSLDENSIPEELINVRQELLRGLKAEDELLREIAEKCRDYFPEHCQHQLIKDFIKHDGLVKKRHFSYFNTKTIIDGKSWIIKSPDSDDMQTNNQSICRILMTENFVKSADDYISNVHSWNNVQTENLQKISSIFLDKVIGYKYKFA